MAAGGIRRRLTWRLAGDTGVGTRRPARWHERRCSGCGADRESVRTASVRIQAAGRSPKLAAASSLASGESSSVKAQRILPDGTILGCLHDNDMTASMKGVVMRLGVNEAMEAVASMTNGDAGICGEACAVGSRSGRAAIHTGIEPACGGLRHMRPRCLLS